MFFKTNQLIFEKQTVRMEEEKKTPDKGRFNVYVALIGALLFTLILVVVVFFLVHYFNKDIVFVLHKGQIQKTPDPYNLTGLDDNLDPIVREKRSFYQSRGHHNSYHRQQHRPRNSPRSWGSTGSGVSRVQPLVEVQVLEVGPVSCSNGGFAGRASCIVVMRILCDSGRYSRGQRIAVSILSRRRDYCPKLRSHQFPSLPEGVTCDLTGIVFPQYRTPNGCIAIPDIIC